MQSRRRIAERSCIACRKKGEQQQFLRYVSGPDRQVIVDYRHRLPGRGAYTCFSRRCIEKAVELKGFNRAFRNEIAEVSSEELLQSVAEAIGQRISGLLGIARKSGAVVTGTSQLQAAFGRQEIFFLVVAKDAAAGSADKMVRLADQENVPWGRFANQVILGRLSGRENRNCIGIKEKQFADLLAQEIQSLQQIAGEN